MLVITLKRQGLGEKEKGLGTGHISPEGNIRGSESKKKIAQIACLKRARAVQEAYMAHACGVHGPFVLQR